MTAAEVERWMRENGFDEKFFRSLDKLWSQVFLRDYFAAQALTGLFRAEAVGVIWDQGNIAKMAYEVADAMLKAREA